MSIAVTDRMPAPTQASDRMSPHRAAMTDRASIFEVLPVSSAEQPQGRKKWLFHGGDASQMLQRPSGCEAGTVAHMHITACKALTGIPCQILCCAEADAQPDACGGQSQSDRQRFERAMCLCKLCEAAEIVLSGTHKEVRCSPCPAYIACRSVCPTHDPNRIELGTKTILA